MFCPSCSFCSALSGLRTWMSSTTFSLQFCSYPLGQSSVCHPCCHLPSILGLSSKLLPKSGQLGYIRFSAGDDSFPTCSPAGPMLSLTRPWMYFLGLCWTMVVLEMIFLELVSGQHISFHSPHQQALAEPLPTSRHGVEHLVFVASLSLSKVKVK